MPSNKDHRQNRELRLVRWEQFLPLGVFLKHSHRRGAPNRQELVCAASAASLVRNRTRRLRSFTEMLRPMSFTRCFVLCRAAALMLVEFLFKESSVSVTDGLASWILRRLLSSPWWIRN